MLFVRALILALVITAAHVTDAAITLDHNSDLIGASKSLGVICTLTGPDVFKQWTDPSGRKIPLGNSNNDHYTMTALGGDRYRLDLNEILDEMGGTYKCESTTDSISYTLTVSASLADCEVEQGIIFNKVQMIKCKPGGNPKPIIEWKKRTSDGNFVPITDGRFSSTPSGLSINKAKDEDEGVYQIHITQTRTSERKEITVEVGHLPKINRESTKTESYSFLGYKGYVEMACYASGVPLPSVKITKDGNQQYGDKVPVNQLGVNKIFIKTDVGEDYKFGDYNCEAENKFGKDTMGIKFSYAVVPILGKVSRSLVGYIGSETEITCPLKQGKPIPQFNWYRNGNLLKESADYHLRKEDGALVIKDTQEKDVGEYVCVGHHIMKNITGKPFLKEVTEGPNVGARTDDGTIAGIVVAVILILIICIDVFCCFFNSCGMTFCCYNTLCGKEESKSKYATKDEQDVEKAKPQEEKV